MKKLFLILLALLFLGACTTTKYVQVPITKTEYVYNLDSIYLHDSIYYFVDSKKDTTYIYKYMEHVKEIYRTDTICKVDSIPVIVEVEKIKEVNKLSFWLLICIYVGGVLLSGGGIIIILKLWLH